MYKICSTEQSRQRQRQIENALLELLLTEKYEDITITELCTRLKMPRKAFYRYFESKESALIGMLEHTIAEYQQGNTESIADDDRSLQRELEGFFVFWQERKHILDAVERNSLTGYLIELSVDFPVKNIVSLEKFLPKESDEMRTLIFRFAIGGLVFTMLEWYRDGFRQSVPEVARRASRILSKPLFPNLSELGIKV